MLAHIAMLLTASALTWMDDSMPPKNAAADAISATEEATAPVSSEELQLSLQNHAEQIRRLQSDVERLRQDLGLATPVLVKVRVCEFDLTRFRTLGFDFASDGVMDLLTGCGVVDDTKNFDEFITACVQNNLGRVLSRPALVILSGREGVFEVGSFTTDRMFPSKRSSGTQPVEGTRMEVVARSLGDQRIGLDLHLQVARRDEHSELPIQTIEIDTDLELRSGQSVILDTPHFVRPAATTSRPKGAVPGPFEKRIIVLVTASFNPHYSGGADRQATRPRRGAR